MEIPIIPTKQAKLCANCDVVFHKHVRDGCLVCPSCSSQEWVLLTSLIGTISSQRITKLTTKTKGGNKTMQIFGDAVQIFDIGERCVDRYTIVINREVFLMSEDALSPQGVNLYVGRIEELDKSTFGKEISTDSVPKEVIDAIRNRIEGDEK